MTTSTSGREGSATGRWRQVGYLGVPLVVATLVWLAYVATHWHPAYEGGLYLQIVREILAHGYHLPARIPYYTDGGVPFAYPPLMFYVVAAVVDHTGVGPVWVERVVPGLVTVLYLVPFYALARELLESDRRAGLATLLFAVTPPVLRWHVSAGGIARAPAMLFTLLGLYAGLRLFRTGERRWLLPSVLLWTLTVLTHPVYTVFFGFSYLLLYAAFDRSRAGLVNGAVVCVGGLVLASPWWLTVAAEHGPTIFLHASNSRTTLGGGGWRLVTQFVFPLTNLNASTPFYLGAYAGSVYGLYHRRYVLAAWTLSAAYLLGTPRFTFVAGSMVSAVLVYEVVVPALANLGLGVVGGHPSGAARGDGRAARGGVVRAGFVGRASRGSESRGERRARVDGRGTATRRRVTAAVVGLLVVSASGVGVAYAAGTLHTARYGSPSLPQTVHPADRTAMRWAGEHTRPDATFLVVGDEAEWFPYYSQRTILVSPWGTEWTDPAEFRDEVETYEQLSTCHSAACLDGVYRGVGETPDYVYVPARPYTVKGARYDRPDRLVTSLYRSDRYRLRYASHDALVFEVVPPSDRSPAAGAGGAVPAATPKQLPRSVRSSPD